MSESLNTSSGKTGLAPGSLIHVGEVLEPVCSMSIVDYTKGKYEERVLESIDDIIKYKDSETVTWVTIEGLANVEVVERIGDIFGVHQLVLEDILNTNQRPKFEEYDDHLYIVLKCLLPGNEGFSVNHEQVSLLVFKNFVIMFKEKKDEVFHPILQRIRTSNGKFVSLGSDYLSYAILDFIIDQNFILLDLLDESITSLEDSLLEGEPKPDMLYKIQRLKREMISIKRYVSPVRDLLSDMVHSESDLIHENTHLFLRDVSDHAIRVVESIESYREILTGLLDIYVSSVSNKMNQIMKVLTVFTSIFIPLTFIAGIYGMNFEYMPELKWKWAYPATWVAFISIPLILLVYFKRKKWL
ncbi:MAG TPA: magnesium and cobalt transport protein CorA [Oceanospirillales bacterium]|jgi:magnesium transporter|nr:magnesium and cobalt transport protein CorA [Oceanospirillales bacterium]|tara:strand:- start:5618 stop:6685 length:1068 start_codon:yes stop_codon:yes gene_type:complete